MCKKEESCQYIYLQGIKKAAYKKINLCVRIEKVLSIYICKGQGKRPTKKVKKFCKNLESIGYKYMKPTNNKNMAKTIYTIALGFNYRQRKAVLKFNGYKFIRQGKGDHELWSNGVVDIVIMQNDKGCSFVDFCRKNKIVFTDEKGRKVY